MTTALPNPPVVGLLGGVGAGKSSVARAAAAARPALVVDADRIGHALLDDVAVRELVVERFGTDMLGEDGNVDRGRLARTVFGDGTEDDRAALEAILHPRIGVAVERRIAEAVAGDPVPELILLDAALMLEAGWADRCDLLVFVDTPRESRLERVRAGRGWSAAELDRREAAQLPVEEKRRRAHAVLNNEGPLERVGTQLLELVDEHLAARTTR